jgi:ATP-dependent RNA helicase DeaD
MTRDGPPSERAYFASISSGRQEFRPRFAAASAESGPFFSTNPGFARSSGGGARKNARERRMNASDVTATLGPALSAALERKGYAELTAVQEAVLDPALAGRDLRITSQTGSGKTVAIGFALRTLALLPSPAVKGIARPRAFVVAPTRELARQVEDELTWLYAEGHAKVASATGGASYRDEHRALAKSPTVIVGTPGRLLDHLERGGIDTSEVSAIVLDEADRMLDLGFREELEKILSKLPEGHRTHLVSATFPRDVRALADRVQDNAAHVEGTRLGTANADIAHLIHLVEPRQKVDALVNLLLANPDEQTLVFARTRADVANIAEELGRVGFGVTSLSGEMEQRARDRALAAFKSGELRVLVATDVAARGIDVQDITRVVHVDVPTNADSYTHRSGRTGRAGRRGTSSLLVAPSELGRTARVLRTSGVQHRLEPVPAAADIRRAADERIFTALTTLDPERPPADARMAALAARLAAEPNVEEVLARLLMKARYDGGAEPRNVHTVSASTTHSGPPRRSDRGDRGDRGDRHGDAWVPFRISWGAQQGADPRRLLAMVCRRGGIDGKSVGPIHVDRSFSVVGVAMPVADAFARATAKPDPRDPRILIHRDADQDGPRARPRPPARGAGAEPRPSPRPKATSGKPPRRRSDSR